MNILREVSLGNHYFVIARLLRDTMFLSAMLTCCESWLNLTKSDIEELENLDTILLKKFFDSPISTSKISYLLEMGLVPVRFLIKSRRIMFLKYILSRDSKYKGLLKYLNSVLQFLKNEVKKISNQYSNFWVKAICNFSLN